MQNMVILNEYLAIAENFDAYISPEIIESSMKNMTDQTKELIENILYLRMEAIAKNAELLVADEKRDKNSEGYHPSKVQFMNYHLIALASSCQKKEVKGMAAFAVLKMSFSIIDQKMPEYQDYLEYDITTCHEEDEKWYSNSAMLKKIQKDKKSGNYHSIYISMYEKILKEIVKYDYRRAAPHTWVNNFVKSVLWEETNPGKKKASLIYENLIKKAEDGLAIKGINDPTDQEIAEFVENEMKRKQRISATTVKNTKKANPTITSIFVADEDGQQEIIEIPDYTNSPEQIVMQKFFYKKIGSVLDGLPYGYSILARIYLESFFESDKAITIKALRERYIQESNDINVSKNAIETALKEIKFILKNSLKLNKQKSVPFVFEPMEFVPKKEEMDQDEEDAYEAFCEEQPDGSKIIKIKKKDKEEKDKEEKDKEEKDKEEKDKEVDTPHS